MTDQSSQPPDSGPQMFQLILGFMATPAISAAASLGIADLVAETPKTADELAQATKTHTASLRRLLHFLMSLDVFAEDAAGRYGQTPLSDTLRSDHPQSFRGAPSCLDRNFFGDRGQICATRSQLASQLSVTFSVLRSSTTWRPIPTMPLSSTLE
jgi:methyltransferase family protein